MGEKEYKEIFSQRLKDLLEKRDIKQNELAKILNVSESTVGKWLLQINLPRMGVIQQLSDYFNVPKTYFLEDAIEPIQAYDPDALEIAEELAESGYGELNILFKKVKDASPEDKKKMIDMLKIMLPKDEEDY